MDFDESFRIALQSNEEQLIKFWGDLDHHVTRQIVNLGNMGVMSCLCQRGLCSLSALVFMLWFVRVTIYGLYKVLYTVCKFQYRCVWAITQMAECSTKEGV